MWWFWGDGKCVTVLDSNVTFKAPLVIYVPASLSRCIAPILLPITCIFHFLPRELQVQGPFLCVLSALLVISFTAIEILLHCLCSCKWDKDGIFHLTALSLLLNDASSVTVRVIQKVHGNACYEKAMGGFRTFFCTKINYISISFAHIF